MRESYINDIKNKTVWLYYDCKGVEKDNGYITCSSKIGEGTTFEMKYMKT